MNQAEPNNLAGESQMRSEKAAYITEPSGLVVQPANTFDYRLQGDWVPFGSSLTKILTKFSKKKKKKKKKIRTKRSIFSLCSSLFSSSSKTTVLKKLRQPSTHQNVLELDISVHKTLAVQVANSFNGIGRYLQSLHPVQTLTDSGMQVSCHAFQDQQHSGGGTCAVRVVNNRTVQRHNAIVRRQAPEHKHKHKHTQSEFFKIVTASFLDA